MMAKLDDFLGKKKDSLPILDLSKATVSTKEEFRKLFDKVPDFKMKAEKIRPEDVKIKDKSFKFKTGKKDFRAMKETYLFMDPLPVEMKNLKLDDLASVPIEWKMLTTVRPKSKLDEEMFTRIVDLGKLQIKTATRDKRAFSMDPQIRKSKNKAGVVEMRVVPCAGCGEDFCNGKACSHLGYESFTRIPELPTKAVAKGMTIDDIKGGKKKKKKRKSRSKAGNKARKKSKSPVKSTARK